MGWRLQLSDKTVRKLAELPIYCQRQKCSPRNVVSGSIRFMQMFAGVRWRGGVKWEWGRRKWRFSVHSVTVCRTFYILATRQLSGNTTVNDLGHIAAYFKVIGLFHIKFLKNGVWYGKSYYRQVIGNYTLAFNWCHFWWPWSTFEGHFSLDCHFHVHFSYPWHAFASHGLPAIAELLVNLGRTHLTTRHLAFTDITCMVHRKWLNKLCNIGIRYRQQSEKLIQCVFFLASVSAVSVLL